jgi:XRE family transcriptional regulator, regulator of sulfur utilization
MRYNAQSFYNRFALNEIIHRVATTLKALRKERGWSLDKTARETGVSKAMLGQIERAESSPTIATLWKIASGFNVPFSLFIADEQPDYTEIGQNKRRLTPTLPIADLRTGQTKIVHPSDHKIKVLPLFPYDEKLKCEIFLIELLPGCEHISSPHKSGVIEHVLVAEGAMEVFLDKAWKSLAKGEGLCFHANQPHGYRNITKKISTIYDIIHY